MIEVNPLDGMRHPPHPGGRMHASVEQVKTILECARLGVELAESDPDRSAAGAARLHRAEQVLLLAQVAANSGGRRGELASLKLGDLDGDDQRPFVLDRRWREPGL
jgi:integrase